jgi:hypothetical protein
MKTGLFCSRRPVGGVGVATAALALPTWKRLENTRLHRLI